MLFKPGVPGHGLPHAWFLKIVSVQTSVCVCLFVCPSLRLLITSSVMWDDMDLIRLVKQVLQLLDYNIMATVVIIVNGRSLGIGTRRRH